MKNYAALIIAVFMPLSLAAYAVGVASVPIAVVQMRDDSVAKNMTFRNVGLDVCGSRATIAGNRIEDAAVAISFRHCP